MQAALQQAERGGTQLADYSRLREAHFTRSAELAACSQRCAELEATNEHLKHALAQAMKTLHPEFLDKLK